MEQIIKIKMKRVVRIIIERNFENNIFHLFAFIITSLDIVPLVYSDEIK